MSKGDALFGLETFYKGIKMRSRLETKFAFFLDALKINWEYEPKTFLLSNGIMYKPDFYLPELKQWIEVKGDIQEHNKDISKQFVKDNKTTLILISSEKCLWYSYMDGNYNDEAYKDGFVEETEGIYLINCSSCKKISFCDYYGSFHCRNCHYYDGDHDLMASIGENGFSDEKINISDLESIKRYLKENGVSTSKI